MIKFGDWGLGIGDWGLAQSPIPNPQSPIPNPIQPKVYSFNTHLIKYRSLNLFLFKKRIIKIIIIL